MLDTAYPKIPPYGGLTFFCYMVLYKNRVIQCMEIYAKRLSTEELVIFRNYSFKE
jgi:hypothetical protein